ncbi:MAG: DNA adenine methylase [Gemmatimonadetes bacterium]|nr:MAG: DNA adenine methylase [Gemmatimonadota bacterium]
MTTAPGANAVAAPFPYFGGKRRIAGEVWRRFGRVDAYVEPFAGSLAVLLARPDVRGREIVNDSDGLLTNFWRAVRDAPDDVARHADDWINELDLHARHSAIIAARRGVTRRLRADPRFFDARLAGWWVWGLSQWIGGAWGHKAHARKPKVSCKNGVHVMAREDIRSVMRDLSLRLRRVMILCGDWSRCVTDACLFGTSGPSSAVAAVFLDPPYAHSTGRDKDIYAVESAGVSRDVLSGAVEYGRRPSVRIALCGLDGEHDPPDGWTTYAWSSGGGYHPKGRSNARRHAERVWFSPHCLSDACLFTRGGRP